MKLTKSSSGQNPNIPSRRRGNATVPERPSATELSDRYAFRRNRTLTGSSSAKIASSNELNAELRSPRAHVHHLTHLRRKLLASFTGVALVTFGLYVLVSQLVATTAVTVDTVGVVPTNIQTLYQKSFESYYAARPAERFIFMLDKRALLSHVQASRPEVQSIQVNPGSKPGEASIVVTARKPIARWSIDGANQYVDGEGVVFAQSYFGDPDLQIIDNSGISASSSKLVASNRFLGFIGRVIAKSTSNGISVTQVTIPALTTRQVSVTLAGKSTEYKLSVDRSAGNQVEDVARINRYMATNNIAPEYVDVRISGKAYYK